MDNRLIESPLLAALVAELSVPTRTAVRLRPRVLAPGGKLPLTHLGGSIWWPQGEAWPLCEHEHEKPGECPLVPVLQLAQAEFPELDFPLGSDLLQLLWCPSCHYIPCGELFLPIEAFWRSYDLHITACERTAEPNDARRQLILTAHTLHPKCVVDRPSFVDLSDHQQRFLAQRDGRLYAQELGISLNLGPRPAVTIYESNGGSAPGAKAAGFPRWLQGPEWPYCQNGHLMEHLLTLPMRRDDPLGVTWNDAAMERDRRSPVTALHLSEDVFVFYCTTCPNRPVTSVIQYT